MIVSTTTPGIRPQPHPASAAAPSPRIVPRPGMG
jgi:hypothetical protein